MWYFYIIQSQKDLNWFYKGSTNNLKRRFFQHNNGEVESSRFYRPFKLVYYEAYLTEEAARDRESSVKNSGSVWTPLMKRIKQSLKRFNKRFSIKNTPNFSECFLYIWLKLDIF